MYKRTVLAQFWLWHMLDSHSLDQSLCCHFSWVTWLIFTFGGMPCQSTEKTIYLVRIVWFLYYYVLMQWTSSGYSVFCVCVSFILIWAVFCVSEAWIFKNTTQLVFPIHRHHCLLSHCWTDFDFHCYELLLVTEAFFCKWEGHSNPSRWRTGSWVPWGPRIEQGLYGRRLHFRKERSQPVGWQTHWRDG